MKIQKAEAEQLSAVQELYYSIIDGVGDATDSVLWKKDIYPSPAFLYDSIRNGELVIGSEGEKIIAAMVLNHQYNEEYNRFDWPTKAEDSEITVIHALGVHPAYTGKGHARQMVQFAIDSARENRQKVIRLDVLKGNAAAEKLYTGMGFQNLHTLPMYYEDTGWKDFELYEYRL